MQFLDLSLGLVLVMSSFATAIVTLFVMGHFMPRRRVSWTPASQMDERIVFLFSDQDLVDATQDARALLETGPEYLEDWQRTLAVITARFPDFSEMIAEIEDRQRIELVDPASGDRVEAEWRGGLIRLVLSEGAADQAAPHGLPDRFSHTALTSELQTLRDVIDTAPVLIWKEDATGAVRWANTAYVDLVRQVGDGSDIVGWPLPRLFEQRPIGPDMAEPPRRLSITLREPERVLWFDSYDEAQGHETLVFALPADDLVRAENTSRNFVQTLSKTFAQLPTGLAVFDKDRRLALFNPALTDLTGLQPAFLSGRPALFEVLDQLRDRQRMPEPKNYKGWRKQLTELENAAVSGTYEETWSLPNGQTYRVTGRPHPDGAVAFLIEDISHEVRLTRRFRAEMDLGQSVLDTVEEAVVVFSASGVMLLSNRAYRELWEHDPLEKLGDTHVTEATAHWQSLCQPTPAWGDFRQFVSETGERAEWTADVTRRDGTRLACRFTPVAGHATLAGFSPISGRASLSAPSKPSKVWTNIPATLR